ncbi:Hypothetical predicted protein [Pelobates cultripes]|uniref:General transcription factor 3C polypeptide 6 n=1 Tax=Pelobates cultripes TaxID=61616 RepID=A0AAD1RNY2_PELCU|nr:Hypothetical predicted protein [Pelobates cultripes]
MSASRAKAESFPGDGSNATDDEYEEEEQLVLVELTGIIDSDILEKCGNKCKILGINTENPFLQLDKYVFAGEYEDTLGTCVIFEEVLEQGKACYKKDKGDGENPKPQLKYKCHTAKKLNMTRTFLTEKKECDEDGGKVEWFQIKDDNDSTMPNMICSFVQESEVEDAENGSLTLTRRSRTLRWMSLHNANKMSRKLNRHLNIAYLEIRQTKLHDFYHLYIKKKSFK